MRYQRDIKLYVYVFACPGEECWIRCIGWKGRTDLYAPSKGRHDRVEQDEGPQARTPSGHWGQKAGQCVRTCTQAVQKKGSDCRGGRRLIRTHLELMIDDMVSNPYVHYCYLLVCVYINTVYGIL